MVYKQNWINYRHLNGFILSVKPLNYIQKNHYHLTFNNIYNQTKFEILNNFYNIINPQTKLIFQSLNIKQTLWYCSSSED